MKLPRVCLEDGCPEIVAGKGKRCSKHAHLNPRSPSSKIRSSPGWKKLRTAILERDRYRCQIQGPSCTGKATVVDHIVPAWAGGTEDPENLRGACQPCNRAKSNRDARESVPPSQGKATEVPSTGPRSGLLFDNAPPKRQR